MSLTQNPLNILIRARKIFAGRQEGPAAKPPNVHLGATRGGPNNYGSPRNAPVFQDDTDKRNWVNPNLRPFETPRRR